MRLRHSAVPPNENTTRCIKLTYPSINHVSCWLTASGAVCTPRPLACDPDSAGSARLMSFTSFGKVRAPCARARLGRTPHSLRATPPTTPPHPLPSDHSHRHRLVLALRSRAQNQLMSSEVHKLCTPHSTSTTIINSSTGDGGGARHVRTRPTLEST